MLVLSIYFYLESEVFSMSIKHPKGKRIGAFDWFIVDCVLQRDSRKFDSESSIARILERIFFEEVGCRRGIQSFIFRFLFQNFVCCYAPMICIGHNWWAPLALDILSASKVCIEKIRRIRTGKTSFNFHGIFHIDAGKNDFTGEARTFELFPLFTSPGSIFNIPRSIGHVAMVTFNFNWQLNVINNDKKKEKKRKKTHQNKMQFLENELNIWKKSSWRWFWRRNHRQNFQLKVCLTCGILFRFRRKKSITIPFWSFNLITPSTSILVFYLFINRSIVLQLEKINGISLSPSTAWRFHWSVWFYEKSMHGVRRLIPKMPKIFTNKLCNVFCINNRTCKALSSKIHYFPLQCSFCIKCWQ